MTSVVPLKSSARAGHEPAVAPFDTDAVVETLADRLAA